MVDPVVKGTRLTIVLMDAGSGLNILYVETLKVMGILMSKLSESNMSFHGVIAERKPNHSARSPLMWFSVITRITARKS